MKLEKRKSSVGLKKASNPLTATLSGVGRLAKIIRLGWVAIPAIPLIGLFLIVLFLFLSILFLLGLMFYFISLRPMLKSRKREEIIEAEYWVEPEEK